MIVRFFTTNLLIYAFIAAIVISFDRPLQAQEKDDDTEVEIQREESTDTPRRHVRNWQVADLEPAEASRVYELVRSALGKGYASSGFEGVDGYQILKRYNNAPYLSAAHGKHYLNNYANETASQYGKFEQAGKLPEGSVLFKDSFSVTVSRQDFSVTESRQIVLGPLFIMRKMEPGFNRLSGDWQYIQIQPDGMLLGMTGGEGADRVEYCIGCHLSREEYDHLYFIPTTHRQ